MIWLSLNLDLFIAEPPVYTLQENSTFGLSYFSRGLLKQQLLESAIDVFGRNSRTKAAEPDLKILHAKIGQFTLENDFLEGALIKVGLLGAKR